MRICVDCAASDVAVIDDGGDDVIAIKSTFTIINDIGIIKNNNAVTISDISARSRGPKFGESCLARKV